MIIEINLTDAMIPGDLKETIYDEVREWDSNGLHGFTKDNVNQLLVEPSVIQLVNIFGERKDYWLVFDEQPEDLRTGYLIVFDEIEGTFGIATKTTIENDELGYLVGLYGSFTNALDNM